MPRFSLGLEAQEQDLEYDSIMGDVSDDDSDNIAESPFSPMASRAFTIADKSSKDLERMNDVLENADVEHIPDTSRAVIQASMEAIRERLIGSRSSKIAIEGLANKSQLAVALEENKGIIQRTWDAIVKFFKTIYDWFAGFFKKKEEEEKVISIKANKVEAAGKKLAKIDLSKKEEAKAIIAEVKSDVKLNGVKVELKDGTPIGVVNESSIATEDFSNSKIDREKIVKDIQAGRESFVLVTSRYGSLFGDKDITVNSFKDIGSDIPKKIDVINSIYLKVGLLALTNGTDSFRFGNAVKSIKDTTVEEAVKSVNGSNVINLSAINIAVNENSSSVEKPENTEINITLNVSLIESGMRKAVNSDKTLKSSIDNVKDAFYKILETIDKVGKNSADESDKEMQEAVKLLKEKMPLINGIMKVTTLTSHYGYQVRKLITDLAESHVAAVALICEQALKEDK